MDDVSEHSNLNELSELSGSEESVISLSQIKNTPPETKESEEEDDEDEEDVIVSDVVVSNDFSDLVCLPEPISEPFNAYATNTIAKLDALSKLKFKHCDKNKSLELIKKKLKKINHRKSKILTNIPIKEHKTMKELFMLENKSIYKSYSPRLYTFVDEDNTIKRSIDGSHFMTNIEDLNTKQVSCDYHACIRNMDNIHSYDDYLRCTNRNNPAIAYFYNKGFVGDSFNIVTKTVPINLDAINEIIKKKN